MARAPRRWAPRSRACARSPDGVDVGADPLEAAITVAEAREEEARAALSASEHAHRLAHVALEHAVLAKQTADAETARARDAHAARRSSGESMAELRQMDALLAQRPAEALAALATIERAREDAARAAEEAEARRAELAQAHAERVALERRLAANAAERARVAERKEEDERESTWRRR